LIGAAKISANTILTVSASENADSGNGQHGHAFTLAATWAGEEWLRLTTELIYVHSFRRQRDVTGDEPNSDQVQLQQSARVYF
jgi:hypothetical protein